MAAMRGRWFITPHAVRRFIARINPGDTYEQALARLIDASERAHLVKVRSDGVEEWRGPKPLRLRFRVTKAGQLLTVLAPYNRWETRDVDR